MDNVVTSTLILPGDGSVDEQAGGFSDWEARGGRLLPLAAKSAAAKQAPAAKTTVTAATKPAQKQKLSYKEKRELEALPEEIESLEARQEELESLSADPGFYDRDPQEVSRLLAELAEIGTTLEARIERWSELEDRQG